MFSISQNGLVIPLCGANTIGITLIEPPNNILQITGGSCGDFGISSPLGLAYGLSTIYWNAATGANSYFVSIARDGTSLASRSVPAPETNTTFDTGAAIGAGDNFIITVDAYADNRLLCSSTVNLQREATPPQTTGGGQTANTNPPVCGDGVCNYQGVGETTKSCPSDCQCQYDGQCQAWETLATCPNEQCQS
jgi:hypothetical protein